MKRIDGRSQKVEQNDNAKANKYASPKNVADSSEEAKSEIPRQPKDKAHCFCPIIAKEHGENAAVILQGLGYKVAKSKKLHDGRKWHFDTLEALEKRWPYLRDSGIHGIIAKLAVDEHVFKGCYNKAGFDPTTWYSVTNELMKRAMDEEGKIWFDVPVAVQCHSIIAGTIYQNIRYHLLVFLAENLEYRDVPFYKVNKTALARLLPCSLSTVNRQFDELVKHNFIAVNPKQAKEYTICNQADLVVADGMKKHASKIVSSTEKIVSSAELANVSSTELTMSSMEQNVSSTDEIVSYSDSNTHCKPFERPFQNTHSLTAAPSVCVGAQTADAAKDLVHHDNGKSSGSPTVSVKENAVVAGNDTSMPYKALQGIQEVRRQRDRLMGRLTDSEVKVIVLEHFGVAQWFITEKMDFAVLQSAWEASKASTIISAIAPGLRTTAYEDGRESGWSDEACELSFLGALECLTAAYLVRGGAKNMQDHFKDDQDAFEQLCESIPDPSTREDAPADAKADMLIENIRYYNKNGWPTYSKGDVKFTVAASDSTIEASREFFQVSPEITADEVWRVLADCVEAFMFTDKPKKGTFHPLWKTRAGVKPHFLFQYWEDIKAELAAADKLES